MPFYQYKWAGSVVSSRRYSSLFNTNHSQKKMSTKHQAPMHSSSRSLAKRVASMSEVRSVLTQQQRQVWTCQGVKWWAWWLRPGVKWQPWPGVKWRMRQLRPRVRWWMWRLRPRVKWQRWRCGSGGQICRSCNVQRTPCKTSPGWDG